MSFFSMRYGNLSATDPSDWYSGATSSYIPPSTESSARVDTLFASFNLGIYPVLIVDDNEGVCILIARMLSNLGFKSIYIANSAKQAYSIFGTQIAEETADPIIFLDLRLPDVPGEKVAKRIIEVRPSSRIILVTAEDSTAESAQEAMRQGAAAYIQKPIGLAKIKSVLATLIRDMEASKSKDAEEEDQSEGHGSRRI
jgi:DNA-binding NtrC family response regulator